MKPFHPNSFTPLHHIAEYGEEDEMAYLLEQGCDADTPQWNGIPPLFIAIKKSKRECVRLLLNAGADRDIMTEDNYRPFITPLNVQIGRSCRCSFRKMTSSSTRRLDRKEVLSYSSTYCLRSCKCDCCQTSTSRRRES